MLIYSASFESPALAWFACKVAMPPSCPLFQAMSRSKASGPRTSPTKMVSGRMRMEIFKSFAIVTSTVVWYCTQLSARHWTSAVSSKMNTRRWGKVSIMVSISAFTSVVLPDPVPPTTRILRRLVMAVRSTSRCRTVMIPCSTYCSSRKTASARLRMAKVGAGTIGGIWAANREPSRGNSPSR